MSEIKDEDIEYGNRPFFDEKGPPEDMTVDDLKKFSNIAFRKEMANASNDQWVQINCIQEFRKWHECTKNTRFYNLCLEENRDKWNCFQDKEKVLTKKLAAWRDQNLKRYTEEILSREDSEKAKVNEKKS
eukprot:TRINITY_DN12434_c0_g1_i1.p1 TRINITY_DN12434_c0_g1~~TRINITY_DN12434_c0_g1_i1.p1  ORF type:complete len:130 (-),score=19.04 TRINITY_DN12434_c0_g1_i1:23-412(-)